MFELGVPPLSFAGALTLFFALVIGHAFADFPLQGEYLATHKNRHHAEASGSKLPPGLWVHCMLAHCLVHAGMVWLISGQVVLAAVELGLHFGLDMLKCENKLSFNTDQFLHYACKAAYVVILHQGWLA